MSAGEPIAPLQAMVYQHPLGHLMYSESRIARVLRRAVIIVVVLLGLAALRLPFESLQPPHVYRKDFLQEYVLAKAIMEGNDPYLPLPAMVERYVGHTAVAVFPHATPHPPTAGLLFLPIAQLDYRSAAIAWLTLELACLFASIYLVSRSVGARLPTPGVIGIAVMVIAWYPFWLDLTLGQLMLVVLLLLAGGQHALLSGRPVVGGVLIGLSLLVKPVPWPLLLVLVVRRDWRALGASVSTVLVGYGVTGWIVGPDRLVPYFSRVLPLVTNAYRADSWNLSASSLGWRLFDGTGSAVQIGITAPPLVKSPQAAVLVSAGVPALVLMVALLTLFRKPSLSSSLGLMLCVSIVISPVSWHHYVVLAAIPAATVMAWVVRQGLPLRETNVALAAVVLLVLPYGEWARMAYILGGQMPGPDGGVALPFAPALITMGSTVGIGALAWLVVSLEAKR